MSMFSHPCCRGQQRTPEKRAAKTVSFLLIPSHFTSDNAAPRQVKHPPFASGRHHRRARRDDRVRGACQEPAPVHPHPDLPPSRGKESCSSTRAMMRSSGVVTLMLLRAPSNVRTSTPVRSTIAASSVTSSVTSAWARSSTVAAEHLRRLHHRQFAAIERLDDTPIPGDTLHGVERRHDGDGRAGGGGSGEPFLDHAGCDERASAVVDEHPLALRRERVEPGADAVLPPHAADQRGHRLAPALLIAQGGDGVHVALRHDKRDSCYGLASLEDVHGARDERLAADAGERLVARVAHARARARGDDNGACVGGGRISGHLGGMLLHGT